MQNRLKAIRQAHKKRAGDMAELIGVTADSYTKKENGHYQFKLNEMFLIAKEFNMRIEDVFTFNFTSREKGAK